LQYELTSEERAERIVSLLARACLKRCSTDSDDDNERDGKEDDKTVPIKM